MSKNKIAIWLVGALMPLTLTAQTAADGQAAPDVHRYKVSVLTRAMGDSVLVRWAPDEFVPWKYLNGYGYQVVRVCRQADTTLIDTLATNIHPIRRRDFMRRFAENDSLAAAAVQLIFGKGTTLDQTQSAPGTPGSILEVKEEQETLYSFAMLIAEMRPDLAKAMGLMYVDRTARKGVTYDYIVNPLVPDSILPVDGGIHFGVENLPYKPDDYVTEMTDSVIAPNNVQIYWPRDQHTVYDIERRDNGTGPWRVLNERPYLPSQVNPALESDQNMYYDQGLAIGTYEYRLRTYDAFGLRSNPSAVHRVEIRDLVPPSLPVLQRIVIERPGDQVLARLFWRKDTLEADLKGYAPLYYHEQMTLGQWLPLTKELLAPTDTTCVVNVTGLPTGTLVIAAYDTAHNVAMSVPMPIRISDVKAPETPQQLRALVSPTGVVTLRWNASPDRDVRQYEVYRADSLQDNTFLMVDRPPYEQERRYYYAVETISHMGASSGLSQQQSFLFRGPQVFQVPIKLFGNCERRDGSVRIGWDTGRIPIDADYYYCIYRKSKDKQGFRFVISASKDDPTYFDYTVKPGETAEYYVKIKFRDGRESTRSNTIRVTMPAEQNK